MTKPTSLTALHTLLAAAAIDYQRWPVTGRKSALDLFQELQHGDCQLQLNPLRRRVDVVMLLIWQDGNLLIETGEERNGRTRTRRNWPPSEKRRDQETIAETVSRCLREEFAGQIPPACCPIQRYWSRTLSADSHSYPGLSSEYHFDIVELQTPPLPPTPFTTHEIDPLTQVHRIHHWIWQAPTVELITQFDLQPRQ